MHYQGEPQLIIAGIEPQLMGRFGVMMTTEEVAITLKMSVPAMRVARAKERLPLVPLTIKGRRGQFYSTASVARLLASWLQSDAGENPM